MQESKEFYTIAQTAEALNVSERTLRDWIRDGRVDVMKNGRTQVIAPDVYEDLVLNGPRKKILHFSPEKIRKMEELLDGRCSHPDLWLDQVIARIEGYDKEE